MIIRATWHYLDIFYLIYHHNPTLSSIPAASSSTTGQQEMGYSIYQISSPPVMGIPVIIVSYDTDNRKEHSTSPTPCLRFSGISSLLWCRTGDAASSTGHHIQRLTMSTCPVGKPRIDAAWILLCVITVPLLQTREQSAGMHTISLLLNNAALNFTFTDEHAQPLTLSTKMPTVQLQLALPFY